MGESIERWRAVVGYEGYYEVSDHGRVRSVDRQVRHWQGGTRTVRGRVRTPCDNGRGYLHVNLSVDGRASSVTVHTMVARAFHGPPPPDEEACHRDGVKTYNWATNLRWGTQESNAQDSIAHGTNPYRNRTQCNREHLLAGPNLYVNKQGHRSCVACRRAWSAKARCAGDFDFEAVAAAHYRRIMAAA